MRSPQEQGTVRVLHVLWNISASRWRNRWDYWRSLMIGKRSGWAALVFGSFLALMLFTTGFLLANTALIAPADEVAFVTDDQGKELVELVTYKGLKEADRQLETVRLFPMGPARKSVEDRWYRYLDEVAYFEAGQQLMTDDQQTDYANHLKDVFRTEGIAGFAYWHTGFMGLSEPLWPHSQTGQMLFGQVLGLIFCIIPLILLFLHLGVTSREVGQVEWSFEWLFSFPVPARTLFLGRILSWTANPTVWVFVLPYAWLIAVAAGLRWASPWVGIVATIYLAVITGSLAVLAEVILRKFLSLAHLKNVQALCTVIGGCLLLLYCTLSASRLVASDLTLLLGHLYFPLFALPSAFPIAVIMPGNSLENVIGASFGMVAIFVGLPWLSALGCEALTRDGLLKTSASQRSSKLREVARKAGPIISKKSWWMVLPGSEVWVIELRLLARDRNLLTQVLLCPLIVVAYYLLSHVSVMAAASSYFKHAAALTYGVSAYILLNSAFPLLSREQKTLWLIGGLPRNLVDILRAKVLGWIIFSCCYAACFLVALASIQAKLQPAMLLDGAVCLVGVGLCGLLAGGIGVLGTDISGEQIKMRPDLVYFYVLVATMFVGAIYSTDTMLRIIQILLTAGVYWVIWQRVEQVVPYALDPTARPQRKLELLDAATPLLIYFVAHQAILTFLYYALELPLIAPPTQMWSSLAAAGLAVGGSLLTLVLNRTPNLTADLSLKKGISLHEWGSVLLALVSVIVLTALYYKIIHVPLFVGSNRAANGSLILIAPAWLRCNDLACLLPWFLFGGPLLQGYLFRSLLLGRLLEKISPLCAILISAGIYTLVQYASFTTVFPILFVGLATGYVFWKTQSSYAAALVHIGSNGALIWLYGVTVGI